MRDEMKPFFLFLLFSMLSARVMAQDDALARRRWQADKAECSSAASQRAYRLLGFNGNWNNPYNQCLRRKANAVSRRLVTEGVRFLRLQHECYQGVIPENEPILELSIMNLHIMNAYSISELRNPRTANMVEESLLDFHQRLATAQLGIRRLQNR